jgi:uncharacterized protein (TIGR02588 family)
MATRKSRQGPGDVAVTAWVTAAVGFALVSLAAGFMLYQAIAGDTSPPRFEIEAEAMAPSGDQFLVQVRVANRGGLAGSAVRIDGTLSEGAQILETSTVVLTHVPAGSQRKAGLFFSRDPRKGLSKSAPKGYEQP